MLKSVLRPEIISKPNKASLNSFGNFMMGNNNSLNSSSISASANNIVKFSRANNISPITPEINNIVSNISTNILNSVDKSVRNITQLNQNDILSLKNDIYSKIEKLTSDYETLKSQVDLASLKANDAINITKSQNVEKFKVEIQRLLNDIQTKSDRTDVELQKRLDNIQTDINFLANSQNNTSQQVESQTSATWIQNIAANIKNEVDGILKNTLRNFSTDYNRRVKSFDDVRPNNVLTKFASLYQNAIGFITYFGNDKNIKVVQDNLRFLKKMFQESFEVAKILRQTIVKIVKQLSNLPNASPNSGGLNLDIAVPGGKLKQSAGPSVRNVGRGAKIGAALGVGALGLGGLATAASGMQSAKEFQEEKLAESGVSPASGGEYIPENIVDNFSSIVERFTAAVDNLIEGIKKSSSSGGGEGGGGGGGPSSAPPPTSGGGGGNISDIAADTPEEKALIATVRKAEGTAGEGGYNTVYGGAVVPQLTQMTLKELYDAAKIGGTDRLPGRLGGGVIPYKKDEHNSTASGAVQLMPKTLKSLVDSGQFNWDDQFSEDTQNKIILALARRRGVDPTKPISMSEIMILRKEWAGLGRYYSGQGGSESEALKNYGEYLAQFKNQVGTNARQTPTSTPQPTPITTQQTTSQATPRPTQSTIAPAPARAQQIQARAQAIATPAQQTPTTVSLPPTVINATQPAAPEPQGGGITPPPSSSGGSIEVPFLPTTNPDNFLTMYSRIVYNIVDG